MPKKEIDYSTRIIYFYKFVKIDNPSFIDCYVGHTIDIIKRRYQHKHNHNNPNHKHYNFKIYKTIRENGSWENWKMLVIHQQICKDNIEARQIEQNYIEELNAKMNTHRAYATEEEKKKYYENNKEKYKENNKEYYENNKEKISEQQKEYRENNKEKIKEYYENNKEKINEKYKCECGGKYIFQNKSRHEKSLKHQKYLSYLSNI